MDCVAIYKDGLASEATKKAVDAHLKECADCRKYYKQYDSINSLNTKSQNIDSDDNTEKFARISAALKVRRNFFSACFAIFAAITAFSIVFTILTGRKLKR
jgi:Predicted integral membrane protein